MRFVSAVRIVNSLVRSVVWILLIGTIGGVSPICLVIGITQNSAKDIILDCDSGFIDVYVSNENYYVDFLDDKKKPDKYGATYMRNFFTHYDEAKYIEPSYEKVFAAVHVLEFVLLAIVYHEIGISSESIKFCKTSIQFQPFDEFVKVLTQNIRNEST